MKTKFWPSFFMALGISGICYGQSNAEVTTIDVAKAVLDKGLSEIDLGYYPGSLLLHGMAELVVFERSTREIEKAVDIFQKFGTAEIKGHGSFISYKYGGSGANYLMHKENADALRPLMTKGAEKMFNDQKRSPEGLLVPPWVRGEDEQVFIDIAFAVTPYMLYAGLELKKDEYIDIAINETLDLFRILNDPKTGLLHQARGFQGLGSLTEDNWSRGNGWGAYALAILVRDFPKTDSRKAIIDKLAKAYFTNVVSYQNEEGMWHQEMTDPSSYVETSGSGLMLFGLGIALEEGIIDEKYRENFIRGLQGYSSYIGTDGSVSHTCGSCLSPGKGTKEDYKNKPWIYNDEHAFGPAVLAFVQAAKMGISKIAPLKQMGFYTIADSPDTTRAYVRNARDTDIAWENDRIAFRVFGQTVRDKVRNGIDVWAKSVDYPILDKWYRLNAQGKDYHEDRGEGYDFYNAGKRIGCGGIALWLDGKPYQPETYDSFKITKNQDDRIEFELYYRTWDVPTMKLEEHKVIEMGTGTNLFKVTSTIKSEVDWDVTIAIGLSAWGGQSKMKMPERGILSLWESIGPSHGNLGTAVIVDPNIFKGFATYEGDEYVLVNVSTNVPFTYYAGAGWDKGGTFKKKSDWKDYVREEAKNLRF